MLKDRLSHQYITYYLPLHYCVKRYKMVAHQVLPLHSPLGKPLVLIEMVCCSFVLIEMWYTGEFYHAPNILGNVSDFSQVFRLH